jgi:hypothetical protein
LLPRFPDFGQFRLPSDYQGRVFKLSQDYPKTRPPIDVAVKKILSIDFTKDWKAYAEAVRDYIYEGNIDSESVANDFYLEEIKSAAGIVCPGNNGAIWGVKASTA